MTEEEILIWAPMVQRAAKATAADFPGVTQDDLEQAVWVGILSKQQEGALMDPGESMVIGALYWIAKTAAWNERKQQLGQEDAYTYRTSDVRALFTTYFEKNKWCDARTPGDAYSELNNVGLEMSSDLSRAWDKLSTFYRELIFRKFALNEPVESRAVSRACSRVADILNTSTPPLTNGPGRRKVMSNAKAQHIIQEQMDGDYERH